MESIKKLINSSKILKALFIVLLCLIAHNRWTVPRISADQMRQMVALENLMDGYGVSFQLIGSTTEEIWRENSFPMGYYALLAPFHGIFNDTLLLHRVFELSGILLIIGQLYLFGNWLEKQYKITGLKYAVLCFTLIQLNPWRASGFTDLWSLLFFIAAIRIAITKYHLTYKSLIFIGVLSFLAVFMRYAYYPLAFIPVFMVLIRVRLPIIRRSFPLAILVVLIFGMKIFDSIYFGGYDHLEAKHAAARFFLAHFKQMDPIGVNAFFSDHVFFGALSMERWGVATNWGLKYFFLALSLLTLFYLFLLSVQKRWLTNPRSFSQRDYLLIGIWVTVLINLGFITALSVWFPSKQSEYMYTWSLISRYFAPAYIALQILVILLALSVDYNLHKKILSTIIFASVIFQLAYFASFFIRFSPVDTWANYVKFYGRTEMPAVVENYYRLRENPDLSIEIPEEQWSYQYLSIYYLSGNKNVIEYIEKNCEPCMEFQTRNRIPD